MNWLFIIILLADPVSITVISGTITTKTSDGQKISITVGPGTYIPSPADKELAKKLVDKNAEIEKLNINLSAWQKRFDLHSDYWRVREGKTIDFYQYENLDLKRRLAWKNNWWSRWGSELLVGFISAGAAAYVTYEVTK